MADWLIINASHSFNQTLDKHYHASPVISCISEGTTEWQRFECANMFIRVPGVTVPKLQKIALKENALQRF